MTRDPNKYPKGWNRKRVEEVIDFYDKQSPDEAIAEADAAWENTRYSLVRVPIEMAEEVRKFIASRRGKESKTRVRKSA